MIKASLIGNEILIKENIEDFLSRFKKRFGTKKDSVIYLSVYEALYLLEEKKIDIFEDNLKLSFNDIYNKFSSLNEKIATNYLVYKDLTKKGYTIKTGLKFGAEFRVYDKGVEIGEDHSKWIVYPVTEREVFTWYDFSSKNRVAHSTRKRLMIGVVDEERDVTYYEIKWVRP